MFENREFPVEFQAQINGFLSEGEIPLAWFAPDLDSRLHYAYGLVVLTNRALISIQPQPQAKHHAFSQPFISKLLRRTKKEEPFDSNKVFKTWSLTSIVSLRATEHKGIGTLHLLDTSHLLTQWKFTTSQKVYAHRLVERFLDLKESDKEKTDPTSSLPETTTGCRAMGNTRYCWTTLLRRLLRRHDRYSGCLNLPGRGPAWSS